MKTLFIQMVVVISLTIIFISKSYSNQINVAKERNKTELKQLVEDVCEKKLVFLGESSDHGEREAWQTKGELLVSLVESCGFNVVLIESGIYDFLHFTNLVNEKKVIKSDLKNAIGKIWSETPFTEPWISFIYNKARNKQIVIGGIDDQIHSTAEYVKHELPGLLTQFLEENRQLFCKAAISNYANWGYSQQNPYNQSKRDEIVNCLQEIESILHSNYSPEFANYVFMTKSLKRFFNRQFTGKQEFNLREESMFSNFQTYRNRFPESSKIIIWGATIHGLKEVPERLAKQEIKVLGQYLHSIYGDDMATIGLTAYEGEHSPISRRGKIQELSEAPRDSIEALIKSNQKELNVIDKVKLEDLGLTKSRTLNNKFEYAHWHKLLDAIIVIRQEKSPYSDITE